MINTRNIGTFLLVALVTVLIWVWAAGETRQTKTINATVLFKPPEPANWLVRPEQLSVSFEIEGSQLGVREIELLSRVPIELSIPTTIRQTVDVLAQLNQHDDIRSAGVSVLSANPPLAELELDQIERFAAPIRAVLPGVMTEGDIVIEPAEVMVAMPAQIRQRVGTNFAVEAALDRAELTRLQQGVQHTQEVKLRLPEGLGPTNSVTLTPSRARVTFTIRSQTRETLLDTVRIQLVSPPEDREGYIVEIDPKQLNNVTIMADADVIRRIEANQVPVIALLHVSTLDKERRIDSKRLTRFMALVPDESGNVRGEVVEARLGESTEMPLIKLRITARTP